MPKIYQAYYKDAEGAVTRHHGASQTKVEAEARTLAKETGHRVCVGFFDVEKPSLKSYIAILNKEVRVRWMRLCVFEPLKEMRHFSGAGGWTSHWKVKRVEPHEEA